MVQKRNLVTCIILALVTCGIYSIYWFIKLTDEANTISDVKTASGGMAFLYTLITCGIYSFYWMYKQGQKIDAAKNAKGISSSNTGVIYLILSLLGLGIASYALMQNELNELA